jgi:hypothetical protein
VAGSILTHPEQLTARYDRALLRALSASWRGDPTGRTAFLAGVRTGVQADTKKVRIIGRTLITLSSSSGTIPVTVTNDTDQSVIVGLLVRPRVPTRLTTTTPAPISIGPGRKATIRVPAMAYANGITQVEVRLMTAAGVPYGPPVTLRVNAASFGTAGVSILLGLVIILFTAAGVRNIRRLLAARRHLWRGNGRGRTEPATADEKVQA